MCGICGVYSIDGKPVSAERARAMRAALLHRGPDDEGEYLGPGVVLGFKRLSIQDVEHGHQPMISPDGAVALVMNGEIYNHPVLKSCLEAEGLRYKTRADTETLLNLILQRGIGAVKELEGMFAFGAWDSRSGELVLARDPMGIKPIYYAVRRGEVFFSSELRSLLKSGIEAKLNISCVRDYLEYGFVHSPYTVFDGIYKLPPGHIIRFKRNSSGLYDPLALERYYSLRVSDSEITDEKQALEELDSILNSAVKSHLLSDVPVGSFLSGGLDSSLITAMMARHSDSKVSTFSIGFSGVKAGIDESGYAREAAAYIGTEHKEIILPQNVLNSVPELLLALDEPIADSAILPTYLLSKHAAASVKVVLSGEGADELFAGYGRYKAAYISYLLSKGPGFLRAGAAFWFSHFGKDNIFKSIPFNGMEDWSCATQHSKWGLIEPAILPHRVSGVKDIKHDWFRRIEQADGFNSILLFDLRTVLADCLLMKADKASMAASLEARVPFLSTAVAEFALRLSPKLKVRNFKSKWLLRKLAEKYIPPGLASRKKHGFWVPWEEWINSRPPEVFAALKNPALEQEDIFNLKNIESDLSAESGQRNLGNGLLFRIAVFALWYDSLKK